MKRVTFSWPVIPSEVRRLSGLLVCVLLMTVGTEPSAQEKPADSPPPSADGQAVDEEEAEFRRRMELEERAGDERSAPIDLPDIVEVDPVEAPEDRLPPSSREHLEEQLTELIMENGRWEPADAEREVPFEPSEAAETDPELAAEEAEAWEAMVSAYHERERAAWSGGAGSQSPGNGQESASGTGQGGGAGSGSGQGSGQGQGSGAGAGSGAPAGGAASDGSERPPAGDPFSALEFLGGNAAAEPGTEGQAASETAGAVTKAGPEHSGDEATEGGDGEIGSGEVATEESVTAPGPERSESAPAWAPPESGDLDTGANEPPMADEASETPPTSPGAVDPELLDVLFSEDAQAADSPPTNPSAPDGDPPEEPPPSAGPPPEPSIWDWLFGLFGSDPEPAPEDVDSSG